MPDVIHTYLPVTAGKKIPVPSGTSVSDYIQEGGYDLTGPVICSWNNRPALRKEWPNLIITDTDVLVIIQLPQGPGGGSDPTRFVASIAIMVIALYAPYALGLQGFWGSMLSAAIMYGGNALLNAVLPIKTDPSSNGSLYDASPVYSLSNPTNISRLNQVIPVQYGRLKTTPSLIAQSWFEFIDNDQYVYILLCLGQGYFQIEDILFDSLSVSQVPHVDYQVVDPGKTTPYHDNVFTSPYVTGQAIPHVVPSWTSNTGYIYMIEHTVPDDHLPDVTNTIVTVYASSQVNNQGIDLSGNPLSKGDRIRIHGSSAMNTYDYYTIENIDILPGSGVTEYHIKVAEHLSENPRIGYFQAYFERLSIDPVYYAAYPRLGVVTFNRQHSFDVVFPNGLYTINPATGEITTASVTLLIYLKLIDPDTGSLLDPVEYPYTSGVVISGSGKTPIRKTISFTITQPTADQHTHCAYQVNIRRAAMPISGNVVDDCMWVGLRVFLDPVQVYPNITTLAMKAKASQGLNNDFLNRIHVISTRKVPVWNGTSWSAPQATRSIAWAAADACRNGIYSIGLSDANIDLSALVVLDALWTARGDHCDGVFDTKSTFWESLALILKTGRAQPHCIGGKITFTRDQAQSVIKGVFGIRNIVRGSFSIDYLMVDPDTPDDVEVEYLDETTWTWEKVTCSLPGSSSEAPASVKKWGITQAAQAMREGKYDAASNMYRRTFVTFQTELDARIIKRGDLVSVSHPLPSWGVSGEITGVSGQVLSLSEPVTFTTGDHYLSFRKPDGTQDGPYICTAGADDHHVVLTDPVPAHVYSGRDRERTFFQFGKGESYERKCLVISARPRSGSTVELLCVVENNTVHTAEGI